MENFGKEARKYDVDVGNVRVENEFIAEKRY